MPEERKLVTVLFADIVGSSSTGAAHDPEVVRRTLARTFAEMRTVLEAHGGTGGKVIGGGRRGGCGAPPRRTTTPPTAPPGPRSRYADAWRNWARRAASRWICGSGGTRAPAWPAAA